MGSCRVDRDGGHGLMWCRVPQHRSSGVEALADGTGECRDVVVVHQLNQAKRTSQSKNSEAHGRKYPRRRPGPDRRPPTYVMEPGAPRAVPNPFRHRWRATTEARREGGRRFFGVAGRCRCVALPVGESPSAKFPVAAGRWALVAWEPRKEAVGSLLVRPVCGTFPDRVVLGGERAGRVVQRNVHCDAGTERSEAHGRPDEGRLVGLEYQPGWHRGSARTDMFATPWARASRCRCRPMLVG